MGSGEYLQFSYTVRQGFLYPYVAGIRFRRASFWQMNGSFALLYGNALFQCSRNKQFRRHLMDKLEQPNDWEHVLQICLQDDTTTSKSEAVGFGVWQKRDI